MAQCFPPRDVVDAFKVPLTDGERALLDALLNALDDSYEVYVQPFLDGDRPDLVLVRPGAGVLVVEVKDWDLAAYVADGDHWTVRRNGAVVRSPVRQVETYKEHLFDLHVDRLLQRTIETPATFGLVRCAVYFHRATTHLARTTCRHTGYTTVFGHDRLAPDAVAGLMKAVRLDRPAPLFDDELYRAFLRHLRPPLHHPDQGRTILYTASQKPLVESAPDTRRKVRGVAGCGKTRVLAGRAVAAHKRHGRPVLVLTFNLSLRNYIHDRISDVREPFPWAAFHISSYHQFFKTQANNLGLDPGDVITAADMPGFFESVKEHTVRYATVLIDEVQDYESVWIQTLSDYFLDADGELVVFGDEKQNVYGRELDEQRMPRIPTVPGAWRTLKESHRLGPGSLRLAQDFQRRFFEGRYDPDDDVEQGDLFAEPGTIRYLHRPSLSDDGLHALVSAEITALGVHPNTVAILAPSVATLRALDLRIRTHDHERTARTFETQEEFNALLEQHRASDPHGKRLDRFKMDLKGLRRSYKLHFWANPGTLKLSTVLSFKGWETDTLVLALHRSDAHDDEATTDEVVYTALTRARTNAVVVDTTSGRYAAFFAPYAVPDA